jgi:hypothetical protein
MLMTTASAFMGQRFKKPALGELRQMGIYDENDQLKDKDKLVENPFTWMQETFIPALKAAGFTTKDQQIEEVEKLTNRNSAEAIALLRINPGNVERTAQAIKQADPLDKASAAVFANDPMAAARAVEASMANLATAFGQSVPTISGGLNNLAAALDAMAHVNDALKPVDDWIKAHAIMGNKNTIDPGADARSELFKKLNPSGGPQPSAHLGVYDDPNTMAHPAPGGSAAAGFPAPIHYDPLSSIHAPGSFAPPPVNVSVAPALAVSTLPVSITVDNGGMLGAVTKLVDARISAALSGLGNMFKSSGGNSSAGFDGRAAPMTPDGSVVHGGH